MTPPDQEQKLRPCSVNGCLKIQKHGKGQKYCAMHVWRLYKKGNLHWKPDNQFARVMKRIKISPSGCWEYQGKKSQGYGEIIVNWKRVRAHRYMFELKKGKIPNGLLVCHSCDNRPCINPNHLFLGTHKDNFQDAFRKGRISSLYDRTKR